MGEHNQSQEDTNRARRCQHHPQLSPRRRIQEQNIPAVLQLLACSQNVERYLQASLLMNGTTIPASLNCFFT